MLKATINTIQDQVDWIELNIPYKCKRLNTDYTIPDWITKHPKLKVFREDDIESLTKIVPTLKRHTNRYWILSIDDDTIYTPTLLKDLMQFANPKTITSASGIRFNPRSYDNVGEGEVHAVEGFARILYPPYSYQEFD